MEGIGMFSQAIRDLTIAIHQNTNLKEYEQVLSKAIVLGLPIREDFTKERIFFTLSQVIINLVDEMVSSEKQYKLQLFHRRSLEGMQNSIQGNSTLNNSPNCLSGNLHIAAQLFSIFCPKMSIWDILDYISSIKIELEREEAIIQNIRLNGRIFYLPNLRNSFSCHCTIFGSQRANPSLLQCRFCSCLYHAQCQFNIMFCNSCFMRFCVFDLKQEIIDPFNFNKEIQLAYFSYIQNNFRKEYSKDHQCIYFHIVKFDLPELTNVLKKDKAFYIKLSLVDRIYNKEVHLSVNRSKNKNEVKEFWDVDDVHYYFYINHNQIKITQNISDNTVIFKVIPRLLYPSSNILVIKSVKTNQKYNLQRPLIYWKQPETKNKIIMIGVYQTNKIKNTIKTSKLPKKLQPNKNIVMEVDYAQSIYYLQFILKRINQIEYQIVDLIDVNSKQKIVNPVRSYGCSHIECFDFDQYKNIIKPKTSAKDKIAKETKAVSIDVDEDINLDNVIDIQSDSVEILNDHQGIHQVGLKEAPVRITVDKRKRDYWRKKKQREKRDKREKDSLYCPICNKKMLSLYTDTYFKSILVSSGFYSKVKIYNNGVFTFQEDIIQV